MKIITRFAPSPTGLLHIGNARIAIANWLYSKKHNGKFILRIDDTDILRSKDHYINSIKNDLTWLGINWDYEFRQSSRTQNYEDYINKLLKNNRIYECYETAQELESYRHSRLKQGLPPIYNREGLNLSSKQKSIYLKEGRKPHYRFLINNEEIIWNDLVKNEVKFNPEYLSDPVIIREDGSITYLLSSVIDDIEHNITSIIRGEDHVSNSAIQYQIFKALNYNLPKMGHISLIVSKEGKISKRIGGFEIEELRNNHYIEPNSILYLLSNLGKSSSSNNDNSFLIKDIIDDFEIENFTKNSAIYQFQDLLNINQKYLSEIKYSEIKNKLDKFVPDNNKEEFWSLIHGNIETLFDSKKWNQILHNFTPKKISNGNDVIKIALLKIPEQITDENFSSWIKEIKNLSNKKGKELFMPIRLALTGVNDGPELLNIIKYLGIKQVKYRLEKSC